MDEDVENALQALINSASNMTIMLHCSSEPKRLSELDSQDLELQSLKASLDLLTKRTNHHLSKKARERNSLLPIYHLPNEVMLEILRLSLGTGPEYFDRMACMALVSQDWNLLVSQTPSLWTTLSTFHLSSAWKAVLAKSKGSTLRVEHDDAAELYRLRAAPFKKDAFLDLVYKNVHRWQSASFAFAGSSSIRSLVQIIGSAAPALEELVIDCHRYPGGSYLDPVEILQGGTERLRHLTLHDFPIPWNCSLLRQLARLTLSGDELVGPSADEVVGILRACPDLVELELSYFMTLDQEATASSPAHLPLLANLTLMTRTEIMLSILTLIRIPACRNICLHDVRSSSKIVSNATQHISPVLQSIARSASSIQVTLQNPLIVVSTETAEPVSLHVSRWTDDPVKDTLTWILGDLSLGLTAPAIAVTTDHHSPQIISVLEELPSLTKLSISDSADEYIAYLTKPSNTDGITRWPLSNLQELSLEECRTINSHLIIRMVESRHGRRGDRPPQRRGKGEIQELPARLKRLRLPKIAQNGGDLLALKTLKNLVDLSFAE
ncbi:hypothetical protein FRB97_006977 [Tulasnella sp. 331]|nr:hypothetical protein FRB97_006977 [Tulasnella sp. 331]KAG8876374.1 hypothetical protein FRB98_007328 [Tulasnella sp. 332]